MHDLMRPVLSSVARRIASQCVEDAVQCGLLKVWKNLHYVDLSREATVKALVMKIGVRAMRDEVRRVVSRSREKCGDELEARPRPEKVEGPVAFSGPVLTEYVRFYEENGTYVGAHLEVAKKLNMTPPEVQAAVRREARRQAAEQGIEVRSLDDIFDAFIRGRRDGAGGISGPDT